MFTFNETDKLVQELLNKIGVKYRFNYIGAVNNIEWKHDLWSTSFQVKGKELLSFEYKTGTGHRITANAKGGNFNMFKFDAVTGREFKKHRDLLGMGNNEKIYFEVRDSLNNDLYGYAVAPTAASILHSIIMDSSALDQNFDDWADDLGYDSDSISALTIYKACCDNGKKLRKIFTREQIETLQELLQDY